MGDNHEIILILIQCMFKSFFDSCPYFSSGLGSFVGSIIQSLFIIRNLNIDCLDPILVFSLDLPLTHLPEPFDQSNIFSKYSTDYLGGFRCPFQVKSFDSSKRRMRRGSNAPVF